MIEAYNEYAISECNSTGDDDTDFQGTNPANATGVGKPGFHSNDRVKADCLLNGKPESIYYKHPQIQANSASEQTFKCSLLI